MGSSTRLRLPARVGLCLGIALGAIVAVPSAAFADAPAPATLRGVATRLGDGTLQVSLSGTWAWPGKRNCDTAVGFAIDWRDVSQGGNLVATLEGVTFNVGAESANALNPADNLVHPAMPAAPWGTCGSYDPATKVRSGTWGPLTHIYAAGTTIVAPCAVGYHVHLNEDGYPNTAHETKAGGKFHNKDNSVEENDENGLPIESMCTSVALGQPVLTLTPTPTTTVVGNAVGVDGTLSGGNAPTGGIDFNLFGPEDTSCAGTPLASSSSDLGLVSSLLSAVSALIDTTATGTYHWTAHYAGDEHNLSADAPCTAQEVTKASPSLSTTPSPALGVVGSRLIDTASVTDGYNPTGSVTFKLYPPSDAACAGTPVLTSTTPLVGGRASSASGVARAIGTYRWTAVYSGDANNETAVSGCGTETVGIASVLAVRPTPQTTKTPKSLPATGNTGDLAIWAMLLLAAGVALQYGARRRVTG